MGLGARFGRVMGPTPTFDFELESSSGGTRSLGDYRGRVVVLFWEDRAHQTQNLALKSELGRFASDAAMVRAVAVVAVGDVSAFDFSPARAIVRSTVSVLAPAAGIEILLDWKGTLGRPPFSLEVGRSNVLLIDTEGREVERHVGVIERAERAALLETIQRLVRG